MLTVSNFQGTGKNIFSGSFGMGESRFFTVPRNGFGATMEMEVSICPSGKIEINAFEEKIFRGDKLPSTPIHLPQKEIRQDDNVFYGGYHLLTGHREGNFIFPYDGKIVIKTFQRVGVPLGTTYVIHSWRGDLLAEKCFVPCFSFELEHLVPAIQKLMQEPEMVQKLRRQVRDSLNKTRTTADIFKAAMIFNLLP